MGAPIKTVGKKLLQGLASTNIGISVGEKFKLDMAQSRFFTIEIENISMYDVSLGGLPVKNILYTITGIETMSLAIGVFRDIPIPIGKRLPKITMTLVDEKIDQLETSFRSWYNVMIPSQTGTIGYLDDMVRKLQYSSYDTSGDLNFSYSANVILADDFTMSRDYESNELKGFEVSLIVLNDVITVNNSKLNK